MRRIFGTAAASSQPPAPTDVTSPPRADYGPAPAFSDEHPKKGGWFGAALNNVQDSMRSGAATGASGGGAGQKGHGRSYTDVSSSSGHRSSEGMPPIPLDKGRMDPVPDAARRPSNPSYRTRNPPPSEHSVGSPRDSELSRNESFTSSIGGSRVVGGTNGRPVSTVDEGDSVERLVVKSPSTRTTNGRQEKDAIMVELLSGQAVIESKDFAILDWDEMTIIKRDHVVLASRIATLKRSLALETKLRDSAAKLVRLSAPSDSIGRSTSSRPRATKEQAEAKLAIANEKVSALSTELYKIGWTESELRTKLLRHTAGVLGLAFRRTTEQEMGLHPSPLPLTPSTFHSSPSSPSSPSPQPYDSFGGHHFFAGNKDAIIPSPRIATTAVYDAPHFSSLSTASSTPSVAGLRSVTEASSSQVVALEDEIEVLRSDLKFARSNPNRATLVEAQRALSRMQEDHHNTRTELGSIRNEVATGRQKLVETLLELEASKEEVREADGIATGLHDEMQSLREELLASKATAPLVTARSVVPPLVQKELAEAKAWAVEVEKKLAMAQLEKEDAQKRSDEAEARMKELEEALEADREKHEREVESLRADVDEFTRGGQATNDLKTELGVKEEERKKVMAAVGDVLRRHRMRSALGPELRTLPAFDDTTPHADLPSYLSSTLDSHFEKVSNRVSTLSRDLASVHSTHEEEVMGLRGDLQQAVDHRERWRDEAEGHKRDKENLEVEHQDLQTRLAGHQDQLGAMTVRTRDVDRLEGELAGAQQQLESVTAQVQQLESTQATTTKSLTDLFKTIPPLEDRASSGSSTDLSVLKAAFSTPRRPLGNFLSDVSANKFSVDALVQRITLLLQEDAKLIEKLVAIEAEQDTVKGNTEKTHAMMVESKAGMLSYQKQVKDLEERMEVSSNQEVTMLERLNDLTESLESTRSEKRRLETLMATSQASSRALESEKAALTTSLASAQSEISTLNARPDDALRVAALESELEEARDQLADVQEELADVNSRIGKQRAQLLEELGTVQNEVTSLKTQLRQEQRKKAK